MRWPQAKPSQALAKPSQAFVKPPPALEREQVKPMSRGDMVSIVYHSYVGFSGRDERVLDRMLPLWHERVAKLVHQTQAKALEYGLAVLPMAHFKGGYGLFNGHAKPMPKGTYFAIYRGALVCSSAIANATMGRMDGPYDQAMRAVIHKRHFDDENLHVDGNPSLFPPSLNLNSQASCWLCYFFEYGLTIGFRARASTTRATPCRGAHRR